MPLGSRFGAATESEAYLLRLNFTARLSIRLLDDGAQSRDLRAQGELAQAPTSGDELGACMLCNVAKGSHSIMMPYTLQQNQMRFQGSQIQ